MVQRDKSKTKEKPINFIINYGPLKFPQKLLRNINIQPDILATYPAPYSKNILPSLSRFLNIEEKNLILSNGSTEIFYLLPQIFKFKKAALLVPSFWEYESTLLAGGVKINFIKLLEKDNFCFDKDKLRKALGNADCAYICNPNNPTSAYVNRDVILSLVKEFKDKLFIVDETYLLFFKDYDQKSLNTLAKNYHNLIVVTSLSKLFSIGGLRAGFCVASERNVKLINQHKNPYSVNIFSEKILPPLFQEKKYVRDTRRYVNMEKDRVYSQLQKIKWIKPFKPHANFILIKIEEKNVSLSDMVFYLAKKKILVRRGDIFRGLSDRYFRISIKTKRENNLLLKYLNEFGNRKTKRKN